MSAVAIRVEHLSKRYRIGRRERYKALRDVITDAVASPFRRLRMADHKTTDQAPVVSGPVVSGPVVGGPVVGGPVVGGQLSRGPEESPVVRGQWSRGCDEYIWALKDVSFEVKQGEVVGIIGRNGAGKTTLLKILSRITEPTQGRAEIHGRVGSLLEVGTGFHPELTGRENIYLNGAILGMSKTEIDRKFDEIVDFSDVEKFIDTPVKHYSSGMHVRLAFAVAAHLEPEILLVDEVLAVGDAQFQKKCLGKMGDVAKEGRTVLFVSHNMPAVIGLCQRAILLDLGQICVDGDTQKVVETYLSSGAGGMAEVLWDFAKAPGNQVAKLRAVRIRNGEGEVRRDHYLSKPITLEVEFWCLKLGARLNLAFHIYNSVGLCVFAAANLEGDSWSDALYQPGFYRAACVIPGSYLNDGIYRVSAIIVKDVTLVMAREEEVVSFQVHDDGCGRGDYTGHWIGVVRPLLPWIVQHIGNLE